MERKGLINQRDIFLFSQDYIVLGGTEYRNDWNKKPTEDDRQWILSGTKRLLPSLAVSEQKLCGLGVIKS